MSSPARWEVQIKRIETMRAVYSYAFSDTPEQDAWIHIETWAKPKGLLTKEKGTRLFGRNTYPTDNPEPHGYELYVTVDDEVKPEGNIKVGEIPGGLYIVLMSTKLIGMGDAWRYLWKWLEESECEFIGWKKGEHGWVNGYEEYLNPFEDKPTSEWLFNLWIPVKDKN